MTVLIGMFLLGLCIARGTGTVSWSNHVKKQLVVKVYFAQDATKQQKNRVAVMLGQDQYVAQGGIKYISKDEALQIMKKRYPDLVKNLPSNPLSDSLEVTPNKAENVDKLFHDLTTPKPAGVDKVNDGKKLSHRILQVAHVIEIVFTLATIVLLVASILLISNTIRLSIFSRRREIEVMKLVGATNWFVRGPFMLEGLICGVFGSVIAVILLLIGKELALPAILGHISESQTKDVHAWAFGVNAVVILGV